MLRVLVIFRELGRKSDTTLISRRRLVTLAVYTLSLFILLKWTSNQPVLAATGGANSGSITGSVTADGRPAAGIWVTARKVGERHLFYRKAAAGDDGRFAITDLPYGAYVLTAEKSGYVPNSDRSSEVRYRPGESATIALVKGGVITGKVTDSDGSPVVAISVTVEAAQVVGGRSKESDDSSTAVTDDRGIYRIFGLRPGKYLVRAGGTTSGWPQEDMGFLGTAATYYPSATLDGASQVEVRAGTETTAIDIKFRGEFGHAVSGKLVDSSGAIAHNSQRYFSVSLYRRDSGMLVASDNPYARSSLLGFAMYGMADGDYDLVATDVQAGWAAAASQPLRVTIKGADATGLTVQLQPLGSISGAITLQPMEKPKVAGCAESYPGLLAETLAVATDESESRGRRANKYLSSSLTGAPDDKGQFEIASLSPAQYHLDLDLPNGEWYLRSIEAPQTPGSAQAGKSGNRKITHVSIGPGSSEKGLTVTVAQGAARIEGRIKSAQQGTQLPDNLRVYIIPAEPQAANDYFRYVEAPVHTDGTFSIGSIPPGKYRLVAKVESVDAEGEVRHLTWKEKGRVDLQLEAIGSGQEIELKPCQKVQNYQLPFKQHPEIDTKKSVPLRRPPSHLF